MAGITTGPMAGKTVLVTGGTGGIGKAAAIGLSAADARVGITGREIARTRAAAADFAAETPPRSLPPRWRWVEAANPDPGGPWCDLAAELAVMAGNREQAGELLAASGCSSLARGALATAADTLQRAAAILTARDARIDGERQDASSGTATCHTALTRPSRLKHLQAERTVVPRRHPAAAPCATVRHRTVPAGDQHPPASAATRHT